MITPIRNPGRDAVNKNAMTRLFEVTMLRVMAVFSCENSVAESTKTIKNYTSTVLGEAGISHGMQCGMTSPCQPAKYQDDISLIRITGVLSC